MLDAELDVVAGMSSAFASAAAVLRDTDYADACPIATVALEVASSNEPLRVVTAEVFESWIVALAARFEAAGVGADRARDLAVLFIAALEGGFLLSRAAKDTTAMDVLGGFVVDAVRRELPAP